MFYVPPPPPPPIIIDVLMLSKVHCQFFCVGSLFSWEIQVQCNTTVILASVNKKSMTEDYPRTNPHLFTSLLLCHFLVVVFCLFLLNEGFIGGLYEWSEWCEYALCAGPQPNGSQLSGRDEVATQQRHPHFFQPQVGLRGPFILEFCAHSYVQPVLSWGCLHAVVMLLSDSSVLCSLLYYTIFWLLVLCPRTGAGCSVHFCLFCVSFFFFCADTDFIMPWWMMMRVVTDGAM